jgi:hypothetical protein
LNEKELRTQLEEVRTVPDEAWQYLKRMGFIAEAIDEAVAAEESSLEYIVREFDALPRFSHAGRKPSSGEKAATKMLTGYEVERSEIFSAYVAGLAAASSSRIRKFRHRYLGGQTLSSEQARELLGSPFAAHCSGVFFDVCKVPIVGHTYRILESGEDEKGSYTRIELDDAKVRKPQRLRDRRPLEDGPWFVDGRDNEARQFKGRAREIARYQILLSPGEEGDIHSVLVKKNSVLGKLREAALSLLRDFPWFEQDAAWFLLTGETPYVAPMTLRGKMKSYETFGPYPPAGFEYALISLTVEPWVSADSVKRVYQDAQRRWNGSSPPIREKNRKLFSFVTEKMQNAMGTIALRPNEKRRKGKELVAEWDRRNPQWAYCGNTHDFWRDYGLTQRRMTAPGYGYFED